LVAAACTLAAIAVTMVVAAPGGATAPTKEYTDSFEMPCSLAGGLLQMTAKVETRAKAPESVGEGETVEFSEASATLTEASVSPPAMPLSTELAVGVGATHAKGVVRTADAHATNAVPATENIAVTKLFPSGLPYETPVEKEKTFRFTAPTGTTYSFPEPVSGTAGYIVTGHAGESVEVVTEHLEGGVTWTLEAFNAKNERVLSTTAVCDPPETVLAKIPIGSGSPVVTNLEPGHGPNIGGTTVTITGRNFLGATAVEFGPIAARSFSVTSATSITAVTPGGAAPEVPVVVTTPKGRSNTNLFFRYEPPPNPIERAEYKNWVLSGSLTDKKQGQAITLPEGSTFNGSGEVNTETGKGSVTGNLSIPPFTAPLKLFGVLPVSLGVSITQVGALEGAVAKSESLLGDELLTIPARLNLGVNSVGLFGLKLSVNCTTAEPVSLELTDTLTREELLKKGWSFSGTTTLPTLKCEGFLGAILGRVLSALLSGPENGYSLKFSAPAA
jgi:hypothetical protein